MFTFYFVYFFLCVEIKQSHFQILPEFQKSTAFFLIFHFIYIIKYVQTFHRKETDMKKSKEQLILFVLSNKTVHTEASDTIQTQSGHNHECDMREGLASFQNIPSKGIFH